VSPAVLDRDEVAMLQHDLNGSLAVLEGFLGELDDTVLELSALPAPVDAGTLGRLLDEDFRPCLACLGTALERLRATASRLDERT